MRARMWGGAAVAFEWLVCTLLTAVTPTQHIGRRGSFRCSFQFMHWSAAGVATAALHFGHSDAIRAGQRLSKCERATKPQGQLAVFDQTTLVSNWNCWAQASSHNVNAVGGREQRVLVRCAPPTLYVLEQACIRLRAKCSRLSGEYITPPLTPPKNKTKNTLPCYTQNTASQQNIVAALKKEDGVHVEVEVEEDVSVALNSPEKLELEVEESFCAQLCQLVSNKMYVVLTLALCATRATFATVDRPAFWGRATLQDICLSIHPMKLWEVGAAIL